MNLTLNGLMNRLPPNVRIFLRRNWAVAGLATIAVGLGVFAFLYTHLIEVPWRRFQGNSAEAKLSAMLDRQLDQYVRRFVQPLTSLGMAEADFKDTSPKQTSTGRQVIDVVRSKTADKIIGGSQLSIHAYMGVSNQDVSNLSADLRRGIYANSSARLATNAKAACAKLGEFVLASVNPSPEFKVQIDLLKGSNAQKAEFVTNLRTACEMNRVYQDSALPRRVLEAGPNGSRYEVAVRNTRGTLLRE